MGSGSTHTRRKVSSRLQLSRVEQDSSFSEKREMGIPGRGGDASESMGALPASTNSSCLLCPRRQGRKPRGEPEREGCLLYSHEPEDGRLEALRTVFRGGDERKRSH